MKKEVMLLMHQTRNVCEGNDEASKGKGKAEDEDDSINQEDLDDIDEYLAFLFRRLSKLTFKRKYIHVNVNPKLQERQYEQNK